MKLLYGGGKTEILPDIDKGAIDDNRTENRQETKSLGARFMTAVNCFDCLPLIYVDLSL